MGRYTADKGTVYCRYWDSIQQIMGLYTAHNGTVYHRRYTVDTGAVYRRLYTVDIGTVYHQSWDCISPKFGLNTEHMLNLEQKKTIGENHRCVDSKQTICLY
jgi:hypothetical protein